MIKLVKYYKWTHSADCVFNPVEHGITKQQPPIVVKSVRGTFTFIEKWLIHVESKWFSLNHPGARTANVHILDESVIMILTEMPVTVYIKFNAQTVLHSVCFKVKY